MRSGLLRLTEVTRRRDPEERRALAALHDGVPAPTRSGPAGRIGSTCPQLCGKGAIHLSQVAGRGGRPTLGQGKRSTGHRLARARGRDVSSQADAQIVRIVGLSLS